MHSAAVNVVLLLPPGVSQPGFVLWRGLPEFQINYFFSFFFACKKKKQQSAPGNPDFIGTAHCRETLRSTVVQSNEGFQFPDVSDWQRNFHIIKLISIVLPVGSFSFFVSF